MTIPICSSAFGQNISGIVFNEKSQLPVEYVNIGIVGKNTGTVSDFSGKYSFGGFHIHNPISNKNESLEYIDKLAEALGETDPVIKELNKLGVTVNTVEQPLDISKSENKILLSLYLTVPEVENDRIAEKTAEGSWRARMNGYWTAQAPKGYDNFRDNKKSTLRPNPSEAPLMIEAFSMLASGTYSADEVRKWLNDNKLKITRMHS